MADNISEIQPVPETFIKNVDVAHNEAIAIKRISNLGTEDESVVKQIIPILVKKEFISSLKETAITDMNAQLFEQLKNKSPEMIEALGDGIEARARIARHFIKPDSARRMGINQELTGETDKSWDLATNETENLIKYVREDVENKMNDPDLPEIFQVFGKSIERATIKGIVSSEDQRILGDILNAVTADITYSNFLLGNEVVAKAASNINPQPSYDKQVKFDENSSKIPQQ